MYLSGVRAGALGLWIDIQCSILLPSSNGSQLEGCCVWRAVIQLLYSLASSWLQLVIDMATTWWQLDHIEQSPNSGNSALFSWEHVLKAGIFLLFWWCIFQFPDLGNLLSMPWVPTQCYLYLEFKFHCRGVNGYTHRIPWFLYMSHHLDVSLLCVEMMLMCTTSQEPTLYEIVVMFPWSYLKHQNVFSLSQP